MSNKFTETAGVLTRTKKTSHEIKVRRQYFHHNLCTELTVGVNIDNLHRRYQLLFDEDSYTTAQQLKLTALLADFLYEEFHNE